MDPQIKELFAHKKLKGKSFYIEGEYIVSLFKNLPNQYTPYYTNTYSHIHVWSNVKEDIDILDEILKEKPTKYYYIKTYNYNPRITRTIFDISKDEFSYFGFTIKVSDAENKIFRLTENNISNLSLIYDHLRNIFVKTFIHNNWTILHDDAFLDISTTINGKKRKICFNDRDFFKDNMSEYWVFWMNDSYFDLKEGKWINTNTNKACTEHRIDIGIDRYENDLHLSVVLICTSTRITSTINGSMENILCVMEKILSLNKDMLNINIHSGTGFGHMKLSLTNVGNNETVMTLLRKILTF